jgi:hypothetical protein
MNLECTLRMSCRVLSQFSCRILHVDRAIWTFVESSITWSTTEKLLSWINVFEYAMCFCIVSMIGRIIFWISSSVDRILPSSLRNSTYFCDKKLILRLWDELELGSSFSFCALGFRYSSILFNFSLISLVYSETSQSLGKNEVTLLKEFSIVKIVVNSTYFIAMCWEMCSSTLLSNFFSTFCNNFSWLERSSLNLFTTSSNCNKMCWDESTSTPIAFVMIILALSMILNSLSLSFLSCFYFAFYSRH